MAVDDEPARSIERPKTSTRDRAALRTGLETWLQQKHPGGAGASIAAVVVGRHRNPGCTVQVKTVHQRLGAMMPCTHGDAERVECLGDVVGMNAFQHERHHGVAILQTCRAKNPRAVDLLQAVHQVMKKP